MTSTPSKQLRRFHLTPATVAFSAYIVVASLRGAVPPAATASEESIVLNPFEVVSDKSDSYEAVDFPSLSGTNRTLDKLPITAEHFNKTMLDDFAVTDVVNLLNNYTTRGWTG